MGPVMKYKLKTSSILIALTLLCLTGFSVASFAVPQTGSCPVGHHHMGHGMEHAKMKKAAGGVISVEKLAEAECANCHGNNGMSVSDDVPNLAGQQSVYMCAWLDGCRTQGEKCEGHEDIAAKLTDQEIVDLADFYAHLPSDKQ